MARNAIQLQKGLSLCQLNASYTAARRNAQPAISNGAGPTGSCARLAAAATTLSSARASYICATTA